ncbi:MAG: flagellar basal body rod protein FlgB [bacterium]
MSNSLEFNTIDMYQDALNGSAKRHEAIADNLSNVNTPGYKRKEVSFQKSLKQAYMSNNSGFGPEGFEDSDRKPVKANVFQVKDTSMRNDKNNVDPDREMAKLSKNTLYYTGSSRMLQQQFEYLNQLIQNLGKP